ncbi:MAG: electron transfer flavoprotein subunit alpha/FixB family protein [Candidatus Dadabacteria bacterium]|nr:MAG: electron transfer flavoprotein subunit alpha/FixB family protein [Candidatus Dadabacteria bacterium]
MSSAVVVCTFDEGRDGVPTGAVETLALAREVADAIGTELAWLIVGPLPARAREVAGAYGADEICHANDSKLAEFKPDLCVEAASQALGSLAPKLVLFPQTFEARLIAPRVGFRLGAGIVMNALGVSADGGTVKVTASAYGGNTRAEYVLSGADTCVVGVLADMLQAEPRGQASEPRERELTVNLGEAGERIRVVEQAHFEGPRLEDAQIIVAGGMGLGSKENFRLVEELAEALGGMAGASRPAVENGFTDASRQVGLTGKITRPVLYIGAGISGASQHMVGCSAAKTIVAINTNPDAAIFRYARYGIVGDALEVLPAITKVVREAA